MSDITRQSTINEATGNDPEKKLRYDIEYISKQSFWFDLEIVIRRIGSWWVTLSALHTTAGNYSRAHQKPDRQNQHCGCSILVRATVPRLLFAVGKYSQSLQMHNV